MRSDAAVVVVGRGVVNCGDYDIGGVRDIPTCGMFDPDCVLPLVNA